MRIIKQDVMRKNLYCKIALLIFIVFQSVKTYSQDVGTMYFMNNAPERNLLNPAFQPLTNIYIGLPVIGFTQFRLGNNSIALKDLIYQKNGGTILFVNPNGDKTKFYNVLHPTTLFQTNLQVNLLDFGFRTGKSYWTFGVTEKVDGTLGISKDLMKLILFGTPKILNNLYDLHTSEINMSAYTEAALGYSRLLGDKWSIGVKLKFLYGTANISSNIQNMNLSAGTDQWTLKGNAIVNYSSPVAITGTNFQNINATTSSLKDWTKPSGLGEGIDLGFTYKPVNELTLSAAITDIGMIHWNRNTKKASYHVDYKFNGPDSLNLNSISDIRLLTDTLLNSLKNSGKDTITSTKGYTTYTSPKLMVGAEYGFFDNKLSVGLLSRTMFYNSNPYEELTASINGRPVKWFNMSISYSFMNGTLSNIGAGIGLKTGIVHWLLSSDYIPLNYSALPLDQLNSGLPVITIPVAYNTKGINFALGINLELGNRVRTYKDKIVKQKNKCKDVPLGVKVDKNGCPIDTDGDGVPDYLDKCPNTPKEAYKLIDQHGCPIDTDGDGVPDYLDKCPDTPKAAFGFVDKNGCTLDTDGDGVPDYLDKCSNTPLGEKVDKNGCPLDSDGDGVPDYLDKCPDTPAAAKGLVDKNGCPLDTDGDGVPDYLDKCPNTPRESIQFVDKNGCVNELDSDGDGVPDGLDKCPDTPKGAKGFVDKNGCLLDADGDGVPDYLDKCPTIPGVASNNGCPEIKKEVKILFKKALQGIQFENGSDLIMIKSHTILDQIAGVLIANPTYLIEIRGHTDNVGNPASNKVLSQKRAESVLRYLKGKKVNENRMTANGYGDTLPVAVNSTSAGKGLNRRVEFEVSFEEITLH